MVVRPEDKTKAAVLAVAIVGVLGVNATRMLSRPAPQVDAATAGSQTTAGTAGTAGTQPAQTASGPTDAPRTLNMADRDLVEGQVPGASRDPFRPAVRTANSAATYVPTPRPGSLSGGRNSGGGYSGDGLPVLPTTGGPTPAGQAPQLRPMETPLPPLPSIELKGVIFGQPRVCVLVMDGRTVYAREGEKLADAVTVQKIEETVITLRHGKTDIPLGIGHATLRGSSDNLPDLRVPSATASVPEGWQMATAGGDMALFMPAFLQPWLPAPAPQRSQVGQVGQVGTVVPVTSTEVPAAAGNLEETTSVL
jgi:hypothetical protein